MAGVVTSSADFDVRRDALRNALPRRISVLEHIDYQYITKKTSSADPLKFEGVGGFQNR